MAKIYQGKVSVYSNSNKQLVVKADDAGKFDSNNTAELYTTMCELGKKHKMEVRAYKPEQGGDTPVLMADRWGKPYIALLPERKAPSIAKVTVTKLA